LGEYLASAKGIDIYRDGSIISITFRFEERGMYSTQSIDKIVENNHAGIFGKIKGYAVNTVSHGLGYAGTIAGKVFSIVPARLRYATIPVTLAGVLLTSCIGNTTPTPTPIVTPDETPTDCFDSNLRAPPPGVTEFIIEQKFEGETIKRRYLVHTPKKLDPTKCYPLLFALHGIGGVPDRYPNKFSDLVENHEFVGIYPAGYKKRWNLGKVTSHPNDIQFLEMLADDLRSFRNLDHDRRYVHGRSNGAGMAHTLGGDSDYFRAFSALVASLTTDNLPTEPTRQPAVLQILGENDELIPYKGGRGVANRIFLSGDRSAKTWAQHNECNMEPEITKQSIGSYEVVRTKYSECANNGEVVSYMVAEVGHGIPADRQGWLDFSILIWDFLSRH